MATLLPTKPEILQLLREIETRQPEVRMINVYKGFPITNLATLLKVGTDVAIFKVHRYQTVCLNIEGTTYIQNPLLDFTLRATKYSQDIETNRAILMAFEPMGDMIGLRREVRVEPSHQLMVSLQAETMKARAFLRDISLRGMALDLENYYYNPRYFFNGQIMRINLHLPTFRTAQLSEIKVRGEIRYIARRNIHVYRLGVRLVEEEDPSIYRYVVERQKEVIAEIRQMHTLMMAQIEEEKRAR